MTETAKRRPPRAPVNLHPEGRKLWRDIVAVYDLRADELRILEDACREVSIIEGLDAILDGLGDDGMIVHGPRGGVSAHPALAEVRQHRGVLRRLLASLRLPDDPNGGRAATATSAAGRALVNARWRRS